MTPPRTSRPPARSESTRSTSGASRSSRRTWSASGCAARRLEGMRVMFAGTPAVAIPALDALHDSAHEVRGVLTRPPAPVGRKRTMTPSPIQARAQELGLPVLTGAPSSEEVLGFFRTEGIECVAVVAYGALIRE